MKSISPVREVQKNDGFSGQVGLSGSLTSRTVYSCLTDMYFTIVPAVLYNNFLPDISKGTCFWHGAVSTDGFKIVTNESANRGENARIIAVWGQILSFFRV